MKKKLQEGVKHVKNAYAWIMAGMLFLCIIYICGVPLVISAKIKDVESDIGAPKIENRQTEPGTFGSLEISRNDLVQPTSASLLKPTHVHSAAQSMDDTISVLKTSFNGDLRRVFIDQVAAFSYPDLQALLQMQFHSTALFVTHYIDDQNDHIHIENDLELLEAFRAAKFSRKALRIIVSQPVPIQAANASLAMTEKLLRFSGQELARSKATEGEALQTQAHSPTILVLQGQPKTPGKTPPLREATTMLTQDGQAVASPNSVVQHWASIGFIKQPKTGGTTFARWILAPLAARRNLQPLRRASSPCVEDQRNQYCPYEQCPPLSGPFSQRPSQVILDHTFFDKAALDAVLTPPILYVSLFREPRDILRSMFTMAWSQRAWGWSEPDNSFCQSLSTDARLWTKACPAASACQGLLVDYFTHKRRYKEARAVLLRPDFVPLLEGQYDQSLVLFARIANLTLYDMAYAREMVMPEKYSESAHKSWASLVASGTFPQCIEQEHQLYEAAVASFDRLVVQHFGSATVLDAATLRFNDVKKKMEDCAKEFEPIRHAWKISKPEDPEYDLTRRILPDVQGGYCAALDSRWAMAVKAACRNKNNF